MNYKYQLDKSSKKFICPNCNKKTFVKYINFESQGYLESHIGRCDRESKCGYHKSPKGNEVLSRSTFTLPEALPKSFHNDGVIGEFGRNHKQNNFIKYLQQFFCNVDIENVIHKFYIGTSTHWKGSTIFWQIDQEMKICSGKVMLYDNKTGKRVKKPFPHINWMHSVLQIKDYVLQQCLFGLHNLNDSQIKTIGIVESEKTAIIMSIMRPDIIWMATGSKANFKEELLKPIKGRKIIVFPDKTEFEDWNNKASIYRKKGFNLICSNVLEHRNLNDGDDLIDFIFENKNVA